jgi:uncharacterized lipoprotein YddW (UPF0748 family)
LKNISAFLCLFVLVPFSFLSASEVEAIRGVWLTNVDSEVLNSRENIDAAVDRCARIGINTIFVVTWNKTMTTYPSAVVKAVTGVEIDTLFIGRDPLKELIESAHRKGIKVIAWFEFGFSASFKQNGGILLRLKPDWAAKNVEGKLVTKNGFEWMNGFHPEVQDFMMAMIMEVVRNYDVDGIQGDDRLPAMPSESGYDAYTVGRYRAEHHGKNPPKKHKDPAWVQWRADILNRYMERIYTTVKAVKPEITIAMAPSVYPWSKEEYLQDWPTWMKNGWVDQVIPQIYRYKMDQYIQTLDEILASQIEKDKKAKFYPGLLLKVGNYYPSQQMLDAMITENRKRGVNGEVFFFYEGLKKYPEYFNTVYKDTAVFPSLSN